MSGRRIVALTTDSFGGCGGIAAYSRDAVAAMAARDDVAEVVVVALLVPESPGPLPAKVRFVDCSGGGKLAYVAAVTKLAASRFDAVWAAHLSLAPLAMLAAARSAAGVGFSLHGSEAWHIGRAVNEWAIRRADLLMPVSSLTYERFLSARRGIVREYCVFPGAVDLERFTPDQPSDALVSRYGLTGRRVLLSVGRLSEDYGDKGFERVFAALPALKRRFPNLVYVIAGDGSCRGVVEELAQQSGVADMVRFIGYVDEREKADHYRMADAFILASTGEGLGIVFLEAQACGIPTIASDLDGGREAVADMGWAIDPRDPEAIERAVSEAFGRERGRPDGLDKFSKANFNTRMNNAVDSLFDAQRLIQRRVHNRVSMIPPSSGTEHSKR